MNLKARILLVSAVALLCFTANAQQVLPLYKTIPNSKPAPNKEYTDQGGNVFKISVPQLIAYPAPANIANKTAVIICPGGGYSGVVLDREGKQTAIALNKVGITCFVLKYRLPDTATMIDPSIGPIQDAQQALKTVRENAAKWNVDPQRIGVMGFSAGGHLASTLGTHFNTAYIENKEHTSLRPDFMMLIYPVISFSDSIGHSDSKHKLLGHHPFEDKVREFSNELHVTPQTPPTFLMHASDDEIVSVKNTLAFYNALLKNNAPAGMHIFAKGHHGFLIEPAKSTFLNYCIAWLRENGWIANAQ